MIARHRAFPQGHGVASVIHGETVHARRADNLLNRAMLRPNPNLNPKP